MANHDPSHSRSGSADSGSSHGASYQLILDHILSYPGTYEMPLRTMYTLNCAPRAQPLPSPARNGSPPSSPGYSPTSPGSPWKGNGATQQFASSLMSQLSQMPNQPTSLPPSFITSFVMKCFAADLTLSLTGLDYLKDLETRRRREIASALNRLGIRRETLGTAEDELTQHYPGVLSWFKSLEDKERKVEALYTQLYVGLRRWILINELSLTPFNKHNCVAMLNTLYPPAISSQPTSKLTPTILKRQRDGFFKYIQGVEKSGTRVLVNLMQQGKKPTDKNGWAAVRGTLETYLQVANSIIAECAEIVDIDDVTITANTTKRNGRKVDSGMSFSSTESRPSTSSSSSNVGNSEKPARELRSKRSMNIARTGSTLEKIARELRNIGRSKTEVNEMVPPTAEVKAADNKSISEATGEKQEACARSAA
ncbi:hypothetical protein H2203_004438 [Taxawa tesnikishii (nom. ined.)]|nr:hypothetical protein H2203_004438 [Dothideales sp. JES 119]